MPAPRTPNTKAATAASLASRAKAARKREILAAQTLLREEDHLVLSRQEVIDMLGRSMFRDGIPAAWLRGYLKIDGPGYSPREVPPS